MKIINPSVKLEDKIDGMQILKKIEHAGRTCYKSEDNVTDVSCIRFASMILGRKHESVLEHVSVSVRIICDRGITHELVRHRIASYSQESTRYCNYSKDKHNNEITVIQPYFFKVTDPNDGIIDKYDKWKEALEVCESAYMSLIKLGCTPQEARSVLPNSLKTEIVVTMNLREWRHFFKLRANEKAHPQMQEVAYAILKMFKENIPVIFEEFEVYSGPLADVIEMEET